MPSSRRRELALVVLFSCLLALPFLNKPYHMDEPFFLAIARQILRDPRHPLDFLFNWYGRLAPMTRINNTPPTFGYVLALALRLTGGREWAMRLVLLPFDMVSAAALYLIAGRFLARPLWPVLIAIAAPAYFINMGHLMPEKMTAAFAFPSLYALVKGIDERRPAWFWASAALFGAALLSKYGAVFLLLPAAGYSLERGVPLRRIAAYVGAAFLGLAAYLLYDHLTHRAAFEAVWLVTSQTSEWSVSGWPHKLRSLLAFAGGCGLVTAVWPCFAFRPRSRAFPCLALAAALLYLPALDLAPLVRPIDRLTGVALSCGALWGFWGLFIQARKMRGWPLWAPWALSVLLLLLGLYWSILARLVLFMIPPLVFAMAESLEARWREPELRRFYQASFCGVLALGLMLAAVDYRYAWAQKDVAGQVLRRYAAKGRKVWCAAHWGLQYYLEQGGGEELDWSRGDWDQVRKGDVVVVTQVNSNVLRPKKPIYSNVTQVRLGSSIPLRLISAWGGEAGFYSNITGFLPYSVSREPLEEFTIVEAL